MTPGRIRRGAGRRTYGEKHGEAWHADQAAQYVEARFVARRETADRQAVNACRFGRWPSQTRGDGEVGRGASPSGSGATHTPRAALTEGAQASAWVRHPLLDLLSGRESQVQDLRRDEVPRYDAGADVSLLRCSEVNAAGGSSIRPPLRGSQGEEEELSSRRSTVAVVQSATATARPTLDD